MTTRLYLVRHGQQDPATGHGPAGGLSPSGRQQAELLGRRLATVPISAVHHSPLARAEQTAEIVARHLSGVPRHACQHLTDRTPVPSLLGRDQYPARWLPWLDDVPAAERDEDAAGLRAAVDHFAPADDDDRHELLVTHNFVIGWFVRQVLDAPVWRWIGLNQENCALTVVRWDRGGPPTLVCFNDTGHLDGPVSGGR